MTTQQTFELALQHHRAGRLAEAEALYRQILAAEPNHAEALHFLGVIAHQMGRHEIAVELIRRALVFNPNNSSAHSNLGETYRTIGRLDEALLSFHRALELRPDSPAVHYNIGNTLRDQGRLDEAVARYRRALELRPSYPEAQNNLGTALAAQGRLDEAVAAYRVALQLKPDYPEAHSNLGIALGQQGSLDEAIAAHRRALEIDADYAEAWINLGNTLRDRGQFDEAIAAHRRALALQPDCPEAHHNLGTALVGNGELGEAVTAYRRALQIKPDYPEAHSNLGAALAKQGQFDEAIAAQRRALALQPDCPEAHHNLGTALVGNGELGEAVTAYRRALQIKPDYPEAHSNLGAALAKQGQFDEAVAAQRRALELKPDYAEACVHLGGALTGQGQVEEALAAYRRALVLKSDQAEWHSGLIYALQFQSTPDEKSIAREQHHWNRRFSDPLQRWIQPHANNRDPQRRLRVGYVSPFLREHVVGKNLWPLFRCHDHRQFEIFCYSGVLKADLLTGEFRRHSDHWRDTVRLGDEALAEMIRRDGVDILVDLTQHMTGNRLPMFARQPAPVQVSFAGYPASTGLDSIGYRISDRHLEGMKEESGSMNLRPSGPLAEQVCLIDSFWCYDPWRVEVAVQALPAEVNGWVTFGSLNNFCKVAGPVLELWAQVLGRVTASRLILLSPSGSHRQRTLGILEQAGVEPSRVEFVSPRPHRAYLELYHRLDIVLDPFPYNGHTTSLDALWMGVPVVSLAGQQSVSRAGLSQLSNLGLPELAAFSEDEYVRTAAQLAHDLPGLAELRRTLRGRMQASPLVDAPRFARNIEAAYRTMWRRWCAEKQSCA